MPSVRFSRDKRGYEYVYLVHTPIRRGKPGRTRVLYWYRTPPGVRIGRRPFDEEVQRTLERQNPGVEFAWDTIINTPMPPPDMTEYWRERRRAEKAARQERRAVEAEEAADPGSSTTNESPEAVFTVDATPESTSTEPDTTVDPTSAPAESAAAQPIDAPVQTGDDGQGPRKRRRRRGGRRRRTGIETAGQGTSEGSAADSVESRETADSEDQSDEDDSTSEEQ